MRDPWLALPGSAALTLTLALSACGERAADTAPPPPAAVTAPAPTTDQWVGTWNGPEGTYLDITGGQGQYEITVRNLDGPRTFAGTAVGNNAIGFDRDGTRETLRATHGAQTGMKWLADKKTCLTVRAGEGYCKD